VHLIEISKIDTCISKVIESITLVLLHLGCLLLYLSWVHKYLLASIAENFEAVKFLYGFFALITRIQTLGKCTGLLHKEVRTKKISRVLGLELLLVLLLILLMKYDH